MHLAKGNYALNERKASTELAEIKEEIRVEALDVQVNDLFTKVKAWVKGYNQAQRDFDILRQTVMATPQYNQYKDRWTTCTTLPLQTRSPARTCRHGRALTRAARQTLERFKPHSLNRLKMI